MDLFTRQNKGIDKEIWPLLDEHYNEHGVYPSVINVSQRKADEYSILRPPRLYSLMFRVENADIPIKLVENQEKDIVLT